MSISPALAFYRIATGVLEPLAGIWLDARARKRKEDPDRVRERFGRYASARPAGALVWLHAASVGESGVALALIEALGARDPNLAFLLSTGTRTSAVLAARRAPPRTTHVYAPVDSADAVRRFLDHWRPQAGVFVESELWPNLILEAQARGVKLALVNARMSPQSLRRWRTWRGAARRLLGAFSFVSAADARTAQALSDLAGVRALGLANLKLAAPAPHIDADARAALSAELGARAVWVAASTHPGEDEIVLAAHQLLRRENADALLIVVPRHPERGEAVAALAGGAPRRSLGQPIADAPVYVADTLGELGVLYDLSPVALVAGSLLPHLKGHNPIEPAKLGAAIVTGPYVESFEDMFAELYAVGGAAKVEDAQALAEAVAALWRDENKRARQIAGACGVAAQGADAFEQTVTAIARLAPVSAGQAADAPT